MKIQSLKRVLIFFTTLFYITTLVGFAADRKTYGEIQKEKKAERDALRNKKAAEKNGTSNGVVILDPAEEVRKVEEKYALDWQHALDKASKESEPVARQILGNFLEQRAEGDYIFTYLASNPDIPCYTKHKDFPGDPATGKPEMGKFLVSTIGGVHADGTPGVRKDLVLYLPITPEILSASMFFIYANPEIGLFVHVCKKGERGHSQIAKYSHIHTIIPTAEESKKNAVRYDIFLHYSELQKAAMPETVTTAVTALVPNQQGLVPQSALPQAKRP
jgi:hypothetical protein